MRVCFFDIDGTLVATGGAGQRAFASSFRTLFGVEQMSAQVSFAGRSDRAIATDLFGIHGIEPSDENWRRFATEYVKQLSHQLPRCEGRVLPGVFALLEELKALGTVGIGLLTGNVVRGATAKLTHYGLWEHFAYGGFGDEHLDRADIARTALAEARRYQDGGTNGQERIAVIGDTVNDIRCARAIDAFAVAVPTGNTPMDELRQGDPDLAIETLEDCQQLVEWLAA